MKFTKEQACKELAAKLTANGEALNITERSISEHVENLIKLIANDEMVLDDFVTKCIPFCKTTDSNVRHSVSVKIKEYEEANQKPTPQTQIQKNETEIEKRLRLLEEKNQELADKLSNEEKNKKAIEIKGKIKENLHSKGVNNNTWIDLMLSKFNLPEEVNIDAETESFLDMYNKMYASGSITPPTPGTPTPTSVNAQVQNSVKEAAKIAASMNLN